MGQVPRELDPRTSAAAAFGAELRDRRVAAGRSQRGLGRLVLVSGALIEKIEKALRQPHPDLVRRLDVVLNADGGLIRLASDFLDMDEGGPVSRFEELSPDAAVERLRRLIIDVRNADHTMAADRVHDVVACADAAEAVVPRASSRERVMLRRTVAEAQQLAGWMMFDRGRTKAAEGLLARARVSAEQAQAFDLIGYIAGPNLAFIHTWSGDPARGAELAYGALAWANRSGNRRLSAFVATMAARAHAKMGESALCERMLATAEAELEQHAGEDCDPYWLSVFDHTALAGHRGSCLLALGDSERSVRALREQESSGPLVFVRNNIIWQLESAIASLTIGELEAAYAGIDRALDYAAPGSVTPRVIRVFRAADHQLHAVARAEVAASDTHDRLHRFIASSG
ncbi:helix-turn-helix domain-containing protein [Nocardia jiangxiensis]|uniref:Helix-turn-helix domain-containing protein n=1 Tax=Nocardia jiangxiensis TaxID=282685 RepID=A0ABW6RZ30_9NOCA